MQIIPRPITPLDQFGRALEIADLIPSEYELIDYIRYTGVFSQPIIVKDLRLSPKPPALSILCEICRKIGKHMPEHFDAVRRWSKQTSSHGVYWDGDLLCSSIRSIDGEILSPEAGNCLYDYLSVHNELFTGFD